MLMPNLIFNVEQSLLYGEGNFTFEIHMIKSKCWDREECVHLKCILTCHI